MDLIPIYLIKTSFRVKMSQLWFAGGKTRSLGFMISEHFNGFSDTDFVELLDKGEIEIIGKQVYNLMHTTKTILTNPAISAIPDKFRARSSTKKDEHYVLDLCDKVLGHTSSRQHKFDFLRGDPNAKGIAVRLPVDAFYQDLNLAVEYHERQHTESVKFFDKTI